MPAAARVGPAEQLLGLLPAQPQAMQRGADGLAAAGLAEPRAHPGDQALERPAGCRLGAGHGWGGGGAPSLVDDLAEASLDTGAKGGTAASAAVQEGVRSIRVIGVQPAHHGLRVPARARGNARGAAALLRDVVERQEALAGARVGRAHRQPPQVLWRLAPPGVVNGQHDGTANLVERNATPQPYADPRVNLRVSNLPRFRYRAGGRRPS